MIPAQIFGAYRMASTASSELATSTPSTLENSVTSLVTAVGTALLMSLLVGLLWSLWWQLGAAFAFACCYSAVSLVSTDALQRSFATMVLGTAVGLAGDLWGSVAVGIASVMLVLPFSLASLHMEDDAASPS